MCICACNVSADNRKCKSIGTVNKDTVPDVVHVGDGDGDDDYDGDDDDDADDDDDDDE